MISVLFFLSFKFQLGVPRNWVTDYWLHVHVPALYNYVQAIPTHIVNRFYKEVMSFHFVRYFGTKVHNSVTFQLSIQLNGPQVITIQKLWPVVNDEFCLFVWG